MAQASESVITLERFAKGKTFEEYLSGDIRNKELFQENYDALEVTEGQASALRALAAEPNGPHHVVVIGEDWCPDVYRGLGVAQRIAEAAGNELRFFERDENKDMIAEYLNNGEFESIPVYVFYDRDHREIAHFIERPQLANEQMGMVREVLGATTPEALKEQLGREPTEEEVAEARAESRQKYMEWQKGEVWAGWRTAAINEVIELLHNGMTRG